MNRMITFCCAALFSIGTFASNSPGNVAVETYPDFVAFDMLVEGYDLQITVAGPDGYRNSIENRSDQTAFLEARDTHGTSLADGLYRYEVTPLPKKRWTREESAALRESGKTPSPVQALARSNGTFRVVNGQILTPRIDEEVRDPKARIEQ